ncbi:MAG: UDP-N-acetylglucosamine 1-carboxyvinyltransferase [Gemmatimonadota bacterium]|nr:MAG: UDP-N-acetylglucosamine 1-carboxyvinyltransferase [Gemmatimonadota bacterium]
MTERFIVSGGVRLKGTITPAGNKNAALPIVAATLMADGPCEVVNVPRIKDVAGLLELLAYLGARYEWTGPNTVVIDSSNVSPQKLDPHLCGELRASILLAGPMLARFGQVILPPPGGDVIGRRRLDTHFLALQSLGAEVTLGADYKIEARELAGGEIFLDEPSVTATENALMAAVMSRGRTVLRNAAAEPHVQDLTRALRAMGARIAGAGTGTLTVEGVQQLDGARLEVGPDHVEIGSFIGLAAVTEGEIAIAGVRREDLQSILLTFDRLGVRPRFDGDHLVVDAAQERRIRPDYGGHVPKIEDGPWPAFPADLTSIAVVVATQCDGMVLIFEKMFESRLFFVDKLVGLGARLVLCDPHRVVISGPSQLHGGVVQSPDIRAGMAMLLAALAADGDSVIYNIGQIDRGYERIDERLRDLGAQIERVTGSS